MSSDNTRFQKFKKSKQGQVMITNFQKARNAIENEAARVLEEQHNLPVGSLNNSGLLTPENVNAKVVSLNLFGPPPVGNASGNSSLNVFNTKVNSKKGGRKNRKTKRRRHTSRRK
jgi:hypothetical protein